MKLLSALLLVNILILTTSAEEMTYDEIYAVCHDNIVKEIGDDNTTSNIVVLVSYIFLNLTYSNKYDSYTLHFYNYMWRSVHLKKYPVLLYLSTPTLSHFCGRFVPIPEKRFVAFQEKKRDKTLEPEYLNCANWFKSNGFVVDTTTFDERNIFRAFFQFSINNRNGINEVITVGENTQMTIKVKPAAGYILGQKKLNTSNMNADENDQKTKKTNLGRANSMDNVIAQPIITEPSKGESEKDYLKLYLEYIPTKLDIQSKFVEDISTPELFCKLRACQHVITESLPACPNCNMADEYAYLIFLYVDIRNIEDENTQNYIHHLAKGVTFTGKQNNPNKFCDNIKSFNPEANPDYCKEHMKANSIVLTSVQYNLMRMFIYINEKNIISLPDLKINYVYDYMKQLAHSITISSSIYRIFLPTIYLFCHYIAWEITNNYDKFSIANLIYKL